MVALGGAIGKGAGAAFGCVVRRGKPAQEALGGSGETVPAGTASWGKGMMVRPRGLEPLTLGSATPRSIQLSYGRIRENASTWGGKRQAAPLGLSATAETRPGTVLNAVTGQRVVQGGRIEAVGVS